MPLQQTSGNVTQDAYGSNGPSGPPPVYVENVFSTYLYKGTTTSITVTNNLPLSTNVAMVIIKNRTGTNENWGVFNTIQGATKYLSFNTTTAQTTSSTSLTSFNTNGFTVGSSVITNSNNNYFGSWSFVKQSYFFDIQTWTGTGSIQTILHNLGSTPGCIIIKRTDTTGNWAVYHNSLNGGTNPQNYYVFLNSTTAQASSSTYWNNTAPTTSNFTVGTATDVNASGGTYIAYIFGAGGTGGFGLTGTQDIIKCGYYTGTNALLSVNLGWEPQLILVKNVNSTANWFMQDNMREMSQTLTAYLQPNGIFNEGSGGPFIYPTATGFSVPNTGTFNTSGQTYIYIAIRRGPMAIPTTGTSVFSPVVVNSPSSGQLETTNFPVDLLIEGENNQSTQGNWFDVDRLRGSSSTSSAYLITTGGAAENTLTNGFGFDSNVGITDYLNSTAGVADNVTYWNFSRAPGFFDIVCYTYTNSGTLTINHNLGVTPQFIITKNRNGSVQDWFCYHQNIPSATNSIIKLNTNAAYGTLGSTTWIPASTTLGITANLNFTTNTMVAYLFATCAGVSYVGSYTGNGTGQSIACGFGVGGARFVLIKRTDSTGNWYVFDSANGLTSSSSPYVTWNTINAQVTGNNGVYASSGGFTFGSTASTTTNISTASYIFLAIA